MFYFLYRKEKSIGTQSILTGRSKVALVINDLGPRTFIKYYTCILLYTPCNTRNSY